MQMMIKIKTKRAFLIRLLLGVHLQKHINCKTCQIKCSTSKWNISTAARNFSLFLFSYLFFELSQSFKFSVRLIFIVRSLFITASICATCDWCMCLMAPNCKVPTSKSQGAPHRSPLLFILSAFCLRKQSLPLSHACISHTASSLFSGDGSVNNILSCQWTMLRTQHQAYYFLKLILILLCYRRLCLVFYSCFQLGAHCMENTSFAHIYQCFLVLFCQWKEQFTEDNAAASCCVFHYFIFYSIWGGSSRRLLKNSMCSVFYGSRKIVVLFQFTKHLWRTKRYIKGPYLQSILHLEMVMPGAGADKSLPPVVLTAPQHQRMLGHLWWFDWGID